MTVNADPASSNSSVSDEGRTLVDASHLKLLVVDNEAAHARAMTESLEKVGYTCEVATSGPEAANLIERETYDIVITDMVMNDIDGMQILKLAKERLPESQVVMVTGHATVPVAVEAMQKGAFNFLEKPPFFMLRCLLLSKRCRKVLSIFSRNRSPLTAFARLLRKLPTQFC